MSKSWLDDTVKILELISIPIILIITIYGFVRNYLPDFWTGFLLGALTVFLLMLVVNIYISWTGKNKQANLSVTPPSQTTSASKPVTRGISIDNAKIIAWNRVIGEKPQARSTGEVHSAELKGNNWIVTGSWSESSAKSFGTTNFKVVIDAHSGEILTVSYTGGSHLAWG